MRNWFCSQLRPHKSSISSIPSWMKSKRYTYTHTHTCSVHKLFLTHSQWIWLFADNRIIVKLSKIYGRSVQISTWCRPTGINLRWNFSPNTAHVIVGEYFYSLQDSHYVIAEHNFVTDDHSMLRFHKSDIILLQVMDGLEKGETGHVAAILLSSEWICDWHWCVAVCPPGYSYGCVVRKKVVFLEELKRDTPDFGGCSFIYLFIVFYLFLIQKLKVMVKAKKSNQAGSFQRFTSLDCLHAPRRCDDILRQGEMGTDDVDSASSVFLNTIFYQKMIFKMEVGDTISKIGICVISQGHKRWKAILDEKRYRERHSQSVPAHTC